VVAKMCDQELGPSPLATRFEEPNPEAELEDDAQDYEDPNACGETHHVTDPGSCQQEKQRRVPDPSYCHG
jgi:hypothetical protein